MTDVRAPRPTDDRRMDEPLSVAIHVSARQPLAGTLASAGSERGFSGWLDLLAALEELIRPEQHRGAAAEAEATSIPGGNV